MQPRLAEAVTAFQQGRLDRARELANLERSATKSSSPIPNASYAQQSTS
jgi:hypothetical protein